METTHLDERIAGASGGISGAASILGSWQICHGVCLGIISLLGVIGITLTGMPLAFLTKIAVPIWLIAVALLGVVLYFYLTRHCISRNLILINTGLIVAGTPFLALQPYQVWFWIVGGSIAVSGVGLFVKDKLTKKKMRQVRT
ncbi:MAG: hypothetical protein GXP63_06775 [DPANN group archaeon]|nr:hypothetical protein [DPANN group archaeon]